MAVRDIVLVPFYRGAVVFRIEMLEKVEEVKVLVPFYRGAVVFISEVEELITMM